MLARRLLSRPIINPTLGQRLMFAGRRVLIGDCGLPDVKE